MLTKFPFIFSCVISIFCIFTAEKKVHLSFLMVQGKLVLYISASSIKYKCLWIRLSFLNFPEEVVKLWWNEKNLNQSFKTLLTTNWWTCHCFVYSYSVTAVYNKISCLVEIKFITEEYFTKHTNITTIQRTIWDNFN